MYHLIHLNDWRFTRFFNKQINLKLYEMDSFGKSAHVQGPFDVWNGISLKQQMQSAFVFKYYLLGEFTRPTGSTLSTNFFLCT